MTDPAQEIIDLEHTRCEAIATSDLETLASVLADDYVHVHGNGVPGGKDAYIEGIRKRARVPTRSNLQVRLYGDDTAILNGDLLNTLEVPGGEPRVVDTYATQVARRDGDTWRFVSFHLTPKRPV